MTLDVWQFWRDALEGLEPETTPTVPHAGFFVQTYWKPTGDGRRRIQATRPVAIWRDEEGWHCIVGAKPDQFYTMDVEKIDEIFSYCCRSPLTHSEYEEMAAEKEREHADE